MPDPAPILPASIPSRLALAALLALVGVFAASSATAQTAQAQAAAAKPAKVDPARIKVQYNAMVPMRDGVTLSTDIYRPVGEGRHPVVLSRYPYGNGDDMLSSAQGWVDAGYVFVQQDVRGRYDSNGTFYPYINEGTDGFDTIAWLATQPWSDGRIGMTGGSYLAASQWLAAPLHPPALVTIAPAVAPFNYYTDVVYPGGAFAMMSRVNWGLLMAGRSNQAQPLDIDAMYRHLPLKTTDAAFGLDIPFWRDWVAHPSLDAYWHPVDVERVGKQLDVPALNVGGWYDGILGGTLRSYATAVRDSRSATARRGQKLVIGPWDHKVGRNGATRLGELEFGPDSLLDLKAMQVRWFDHWLKQQDTGFLREAPVRLFVMGENRWRDEQEWPLARTRYTRYYFHSDGKANTADGDGRLDTRKPRAADTDAGAASAYRYDPADPVMTLGGNLTPERYAGPYDQAASGRRDDVLVFTSAPLDKPVEVTGLISVTLYAVSSAPDTDFTAKLVDVHPDGKAYNLADGIIRARYRKSFQQPELLTPGEVYEYTIDLWATSNLFKAGHRIRVDVSSSNFPKYDRNPNTGHAFGADAELKVAEQRVLHSSRYPSHIVLPVIPR
ncbi:CocE/NonD family hydrolase [Luteimonas sp. RIT-PG2_3]